MDILKVKSFLQGAGFGDDLSTTGILANVWGPKCVADLKKYQQSKGIDQTGSVGPKTFASMFGDTEIPDPSDETQLKPFINVESSDLKTRAMQIAISQNGVRELTGNNDGPAVETYLASVGLDKGYSWCMAFVYWCYMIAAQQLGIKNPLVQTGGCLAQWNETLCDKVDIPQSGDIFILDEGDGNGHTGIIVDIEGDNMGTIDANADDIDHCCPV